MRFFPTLIAIAICISAAHAWAQDAGGCSMQDRACVIGTLRESAAAIDTPAWRDQTYREIAKTLTAEKDIDAALAYIAKIENPDTKAMTIRGIGMAAAEHNFSKAEEDALWAKLRTEAEKIDHPPSYAIALTYIAMAQAFADDDEGAWKTAADMENDALRHKAYGETAEIQAEKGKYEAAMKSIAFIDSAAYRNKAYSIVSKILADHGLLQEAYDAAMKITNAYKKSSAIQYVLDVQKPREQPH